jgi:uncharacterized phage protein (TIGR02218 family)
MKSVSAALITLLAGNQFIFADLYTITTITGGVFRYTNADIDLTVSGNAFLSTGPRIKRGQTRTIVGLEVDTLELTLYADTTNLIGGVPILQALQNGALDGAYVKLERVFMATWGDTSAGTIILFTGRVSEAQFSRTEANVKIKSDLELLNVQMPRNLYQPSCLHTLFDSGCGILKSSNAHANTVASGSTKSLLICGSAIPASFYDQGTVTFTSGLNNGVTRTIKSNSAGAINLSYPLQAAPSAGDTFNAYPGCDKTQSTCTNKYGNVANFRGFPYIPIAETAL